MLLGACDYDPLVVRTWQWDSGSLIVHLVGSTGHGFSAVQLYVHLHGRVVVLLAGGWGREKTSCVFELNKICNCGTIVCGIITVVLFVWCYLCGIIIVVLSLWYYHCGIIFVVLSLW